MSEHIYDEDFCESHECVAAVVDDPGKVHEFERWCFFMFKDHSSNDLWFTGDSNWPRWCLAWDRLGLWQEWREDSHRYQRPGGGDHE